jgi:DNA-binding NtrC family response regulator
MSQHLEGMRFLKMSAPEKSNDSVSSAPPEKLKIVVIDDDVAILSSIKVVLKKKFNVLCFSDPEAGATEAAAPGVALVILDMKMPIKDGIWVFHKIRERSQVPIIINSAYQDLALPSTMTATHKPFAYLAKGESLKEFLETVERAVSQYK